MDTAVAQAPGRVTGWPEAPYRGLNFYTASDAPLFCERDIDVDACAKLVGRYDTKMLLLHGRTGTGKSSFLRAGLFPRAFLGNPNFYCLTERLSGEPVMVRSTADPVGSIIETLYVHLSNPASFGDVPHATREEALARLDFPPGITERQRSKGLADALQLITSQLAGTFLLAIDQAEEVFTLDTHENDARRSAYFEFLENLCYRRFDIKVLLVLRTEYYGQFADNFKIGPDLTVTKIHSGLDQFMLRGIHDAERLESAIERPTLTTPVAGLLAPAEKYGFTFEPGLARMIANDVVKHCGESSSLPVVQMVCLDLYSAVKSQSLSRATEIKQGDYMTRGGVEGAIDRFISFAIRDCMAACGWSAGEEETDRWCDILGLLVARQEGGALTSLLLPESELVNQAQSCRMSGPVRECLHTMAQERFRLLRSVKLRDCSSRVHTLHYSLGHDALAPSLFQRKQERGRILEEQARTQRAHRRLREFKRRVAIAGAGAVALVAIATSFAVSTKSSAMTAVLKSVDAEPQVRLRLLTLAALMKNPSWITRPFLPMDAVQRKLRDTLHQAPIFAEDTAAAGFSRDGRTIARVDSKGSVYSTRFDITGRRAAALPIGTIKLPPIFPSPLLAVGFVDGLAEPVVFSEDVLYFKAAEDMSGFVTNDLRAQIKGENGRFPEFGAGAFRLITWRQGPGIQTTQQFHDFRFDKASGKFVALSPAPTKISFNSRFAPAYADTSGLFAFTERDEITRPDDGAGISLFVTSRSSPSKSRVLESGSQEPRNVPVENGAMDQSPFIPWSIAFLPSADTLVYRDALGRVNFLQNVNGAGEGKQPVSSFSIDKSQQSQWQSLLVPLRPQWPFARPALAAAGVSRDAYRVAWLTENGVSVFRTLPGGRMIPLEDRSTLFNTLRPMDSFTHLRFSDDGDLLLLSQQIGNKVVVRLWDISDSRDKRINSMKDTALVSEACDVTGQTMPDGPGNQMTLAETDQLPHSWQKQPCS